MRAVAGSRSHVLACMLVIGASLSACGGGDSGGDTAQVVMPPDIKIPEVPGTPGVPSANRAPTISGNAAGSVTAGQTYSFQPQASDPDQDVVTFTIANRPNWATFNAQTGQLSGTPTEAHVGSYPDIEIAATDGHSVVALPTFAITVAPGSGGTGTAGAVTLAWDAPTENEDGSPLADLQGYRIHYGTASHRYANTVEVSNPGITRYVVDNLARGTYFFAVTALNSAGIESEFSAEVTTTVN